MARDSSRPNPTLDLSEEDVRSLKKESKRLQRSGMLGCFCMLILGGDRIVWEAYGVGSVAIVMAFLGMILNHKAKKNSLTRPERHGAAGFATIFDLTACLCHFGFAISWLVSLVSVAQENDSKPSFFFWGTDFARRWKLSWTGVLGVLSAIVALNIIAGVAFAFAVSANFRVGDLDAKWTTIRSRRQATEMAELRADLHEHQHQAAATGAPAGVTVGAVPPPMVAPPPGAHYYQPVYAPQQAGSNVPPQVIGYYVYPPAGQGGQAPPQYVAAIPGQPIMPMSPIPPSPIPISPAPPVQQQPHP